MVTENKNANQKAREMSTANEETTNAAREKDEPPIFFFVKVFSKAEYAEAFLDGNIYFNRLSYFKDIEDEDSPARGDRYEGTMEWRQPADVKKLTTTINGRDFELGPIAAPLRAQWVGLNDVHVFCLYAAQAGNLVDVELEGTNLVGAKLHVPPELARFGEHVVLIENEPFIHRLATVINATSWGRTNGLVEYYDPGAFSGEFTADEAVLKKRNEFAYQNEYRVAFHDGTSGTKGMTLPIGSLRDIARRVHGEDLRGGITLNIGRTKPV